MEQMLLEDVLRHMEDREVIWDSERGFTKSKPCLASLTAFYDTDYISEQREYIYLDSCEVFDTVRRIWCMDCLVE